MMISHERISYRLAVAAVVSLTAASAALGGSDAVPDYDFDWATIGDPGNAGWSGEIPFLENGTGRGAVDYTFRMSKKEVSSVQWLEFITTMGPVLGDPDFAEPSRFGYFSLSPGNYLGYQPDFENSPVFGITWREAAMFANWLHNDKEASVEAISNGAYDISTFGTIPDPMYGETFTDQLTRNPDAKFWIPSLDEWIKAAHYDPNRNGPGEGGYWMYSHTSDTALTPGPPGEGQSSAGFFNWEYGGFDEWTAQAVPLGSYPDVTSPWGLLDVSGGSLEWTEESRYDVNRVTMGTYASGGSGKEFFSLDRIDRFGSREPGDFFETTIRVASLVPATGPVGVYALAFTFISMRRKR